MKPLWPELDSYRESVKVEFQETDREQLLHGPLRSTDFFKSTEVSL